MTPLNFFNPAPRFSRRYLLRLAIFAAVLWPSAFLGLLVYLIYSQVQVFATPVRNANIGTPGGIAAVYHEVVLTTADGLKIGGWHIPGSRPNGIILVHGLNTNRAAMLPQASALAEAGYHLFLIDLRGHGLSDGAEVTYGYREAFDVLAGVDFLMALPNIRKVGALGISLGGAAVARAAALDPRLSAVVIEGSYSSLADAVEDAFDDLSIFPRWPFAPLLVALTERRLRLDISQVNSARDLATIHPRAVMIIHGDGGLFPRRHAYKMFAAAQEPKELWLLDSFGHGNPVIGGKEQYKRRVTAFFDRAFGDVERASSSAGGKRGR